jgi:hypothetical protein
MILFHWNNTKRIITKYPAKAALSFRPTPAKAPSHLLLKVALIDDAVQIFGALGVMKGEPVERLYREIWPLRIYEGATEIQKLVIARGIIKAFQAAEDSAPAS